MKRLSK